MPSSRPGPPTRAHRQHSTPHPSLSSVWGTLPQRGSAPGAPDRRWDTARRSRALRAPSKSSFLAISPGPEPWGDLAPRCHASIEGSPLQKARTPCAQEGASPADGCEPVAPVGVPGTLTLLLGGARRWNRLTEQENPPSPHPPPAGGRGKKGVATVRERPLGRHLSPLAPARDSSHLGRRPRGYWVRMPDLGPCGLYENGSPGERSRGLQRHAEPTARSQPARLAVQARPNPRGG